MCSMIGVLPTGTKGFGRFAVMGRNREPSPPAITTAFIALGPFMIFTAPFPSGRIAKSIRVSAVLRCGWVSKLVSTLEAAFPASDIHHSWQP